MSKNSSQRNESKTVSATLKKSRPNTGVSSISRPYALTPIRRSKKASPVRCRNNSKDISVSPYTFSPKKPKVFSFSSIYLQYYPLKESIFAWNCKTTENKFTQIRPCVILKTDLPNNSQLFGFCDGENKESSSKIVSTYLETVEKSQKFSKGGKKMLKLAYIDVIGSLKKTDFVPTPHEMCIVYIRNKKLSIFNLGTCGVIIGKRTLKGWESEVLSTSSEVLLEDKDKVLVLCNSSLLSTNLSSSIIKVAGNYWEMKNPNIASWEITELAPSLKSPLCIVIYLS